MVSAIIALKNLYVSFFTVKVKHRDTISNWSWLACFKNIDHTLLMHFVVLGEILLFQIILLCSALYLPIVCELINKTASPVTLLDSSWSIEEDFSSLNYEVNINQNPLYSTLQSHIQYAYSRPTRESRLRTPISGNFSHSMGQIPGWWDQHRWAEALRCYRRELLISLSDRLKIPLLTISSIDNCQGIELLQASRQQRLSESNFNDNYVPSLVLSIAPRVFPLNEMLREMALIKEESWKGFAIVHDRSQGSQVGYLVTTTVFPYADLQKYQKTLESLQTNVIIRAWGGDAFTKTHIMREVKHMQTYFIDLTLNNILNFFSLLFTLIRRSAVHYCILAARRLVQSQTPVPDRLTCKPVRVSVKQTSVGDLVYYKEGPNIAYTHGRTFYEGLKSAIEEKIGFIMDDDGELFVNYSVELLQLKRRQITKYADWNKKTGFIYAKRNESPLTTIANEMKNKTFIVTTIEDPPFVIYEPYREGKYFEGNDQWTGFAMELLRYLSIMNNFNYVIKPVEDRKFGTVDESTGKWNGLIGELVYKKAHLAVASLTITYDRERVIDFTTPFMSLSLSVIIKKSRVDPGLQFTAPLSSEVWLSIFIAYVVVSVVLYVIGRITPDEWYFHHPCSQAVENQFTLLNSFWFTVGSLMQQGCDISPRATSTRIIGTIWWFFILVMVSSYTANLAAFLTIDRMETDIENVDDLVRQTKIKYGTLLGGSTYSFFKNSDIPNYRRMWHVMDSNRSMFFNKTEDGIERVKGGNFAFILESTLNEYYTQRNCDLTSLGGLLDPRGYGIGLPIGNNGLRDLLSESILKLQKDQTLEKMRQHWLLQYNVSVPCYMRNSQSPYPSRSKLTLSKMSSAFIGLACGILFGLCVWLLEIIFWICRAHKRSTVFCGPCSEGHEEYIDQTRVKVEEVVTPIKTGHHNTTVTTYHKITAL